MLHISYRNYSVPSFFRTLTTVRYFHVLSGLFYMQKIKGAPLPCPCPCPGAMQKLGVWDLFWCAFSWAAAAAAFWRMRSASCTHSARSSCFQHRSVRSAKSLKLWWWPSIPKSAAHLEWMRTSDFPVCMFEPSPPLPLTCPGGEARRSCTNTEELISTQHSFLLLDAVFVRPESEAFGNKNRPGIRCLTLRHWQHMFLNTATFRLVFLSPEV